MIQAEDIAAAAKERSRNLVLPTCSGLIWSSVNACVRLYQNSAVLCEYTASAVVVKSMLQPCIALSSTDQLIGFTADWLCDTNQHYMDLFFIKNTQEQNAIQAHVHCFRLSKRLCSSLSEVQLEAPSVRASVKRG